MHSVLKTVAIFSHFIKLLKSVNSTFTLAIRSQKFGQAKVSCWEKKEEKNMAKPGFEPTISRSEVDHASHYSIGPLLEY